MPQGRPRTPEEKAPRLQERLRHSAKLGRRQKRGMGYSHYPTKRLYEDLGLYRLPTRRPGTPAHACG